MLKLDISQALSFLDRLDPGGRHALASEAPFAGVGGGPKWEAGATYEAHQRMWLIEDIEERQARGSNCYYGVNKPCFVADQQGYNGKCNANDIIAIRALAFDVDFKTKKDPDLVKTLSAFIDERLIGPLRPSLVVDSGGGFQTIYLLKEMINAIEHPDQRRAITDLADDFEALLSAQAPSFVKIDNMSNVDRVMRLRGTINFPKAEKIARGQVEALAHIAVDYGVKCDIRALRDHVPKIHEALQRQKSLE